MATGISAATSPVNSIDLAQVNTGKEKLLPDGLNRNDGDWHPEWLGGGKVDVRFKGWDTDGKAVYQAKGGSSIVDIHTNSYDKAATRAAELVRNKALTPRSGELGVAAPSLKPKVTPTPKLTTPLSKKPLSTTPLSTTPLSKKPLSTTPLSKKLGTPPVQKTTVPKTNGTSSRITNTSAAKQTLAQSKRNGQSTQIDIPNQLRQSGLYTASGAEFSQLIGNGMGQDRIISAVMTGPNAIKDIALIPKIPTNLGDLGNTVFKGVVNSGATYGSFAAANKYIGVTPDRIVRNTSYGAGVTVPFTSWGVDSIRTNNPNTILGSNGKPKNTGDVVKQGVGNAVAVGSGVGIPALVSSLIELKKDPAMTIGKVFFNTGLATVAPGFQAFGATVLTSDPKLRNGMGSAAVGIGTNWVGLNVADKASRAYATNKGTPVPAVKNKLRTLVQAALIEGTTEVLQCASYMADLESTSVDLRNTNTAKDMLEKIDYILKAPIGLVGKAIDKVSGRTKAEKTTGTQDWGKTILNRLQTTFTGSNTIGGKNYVQHYKDMQKLIYDFHPELKPKS